MFFVAEQKGIAEEKAGAPLSWEDTRKMKYTWRVCQETLRLQPPVQAAFRKAIQDFEYEGHTIPKGWTVSFLTFFSNIILNHLLNLGLSNLHYSYSLWIKTNLCILEVWFENIYIYSLGPLNNLGDWKSVMFTSHNAAILCLSTPQGLVT